MEMSVSGPMGLVAMSLTGGLLAAGGPARDVGREVEGKSTGVVHEKRMRGTHVSDTSTDPEAVTFRSGRFPPSAVRSSFLPGQSLYSSVS